MSDKCVLDHCKRASRAVCQCCQQNLCLQHLWEHTDRIVAQLSPLKRAMDEVHLRFRTFDTPTTLSNFEEQMKKWRTDSYAAIDQFFDRKCEEMNRYVNQSTDKQRHEIDCLQKRLDLFLETEKGNQQDIESIQSNIQELNDNITQLQQKSSKFTLVPIVVGEDVFQS